MHVRAPRRPRLTYANVMSTLAVLLALGGTAWGVSGGIGSSGILDGSVRSVDIRDNSIASVDIQNGTINKVDLAPAVAAGVGATPVAFHAVDVHPGNGHVLAGQDLAVGTLKLPSGAGPWLIDMTADFTPYANGQESVVGCVFLIDGQVQGLPYGHKLDRSNSLLMTWHDAYQTKGGSHTVGLRCTTSGEVVTKQVALTAIAYRLPAA